MKTFKIVSLHIKDRNEYRNIPFIDCLIINKEDGKGTWLIEIYMDRSFLPFFSGAEKANRVLETEVIITYENNDPAPLATRVCGIKIFEKTISVLLEGKIRSRRNAYAENLLESLIDNGYVGEQLVQAFKAGLNNKERSALNNSKN